MLANTRTSRTWDHEAIFAKIPGDHSELWDFNYIHNLVVGIHHADLEAALLKPNYRQLLDCPDAYGRTPLFWAAIRGDVGKVKTLLAAGADHTKTDLERRSPLHAALQSGNISCVETLLRRGSSVHARDRYGNTALQIATWADDNNEAMLEAIFMAGASVDVKEEYGTSALASAACLNYPANAKWLLSKGADIESRDIVGCTPLYEAVRYCNTEMVELLLAHGARADFRVKNGRTVLHALACTGSLATTEVLMQFPLQGLNAESRDSSDLTAWELFENRVGQPEGMRDAFLRLLDYVKRLNADEDDDEDEEDAFVDALEALVVVD